MNIIRSPRFWMWMCRTIPLVVGSGWLLALLFTDAFAPTPPVGALEILLAPGTIFEGFGIPWLEMALVLLLVPHLLIVLFVLPALLFPERPGFKSILGYLSFALLTAGIGPYLWYLLTVDPILSRMVGQRFGSSVGTAPP